jgi:PAS domain S-box-containing protein
LFQLEGIEAAVGIGAIVLPAMAWVVRRVVLATRQFSRVVDTHGELASKLTDIKKQLVANGGSSLFDLVKETKTKVEVLGSDVQRVKAWQVSFSQAYKMPMWESDEKGSCIRVNVAMTDLTGRSSEQMSGSGWENVLPPGPERQQVWEAWNDAVTRARDFEHVYTVIHSQTQKRSRVRAVANPILGADRRPVGWLGRFEEVTPL